MNIQLTKNDALKVAEYITAYNDFVETNSPLEQNLVNFYLHQLPGTFPEDALHIVNDIKKGVKAFNDTLNEALSNNGINYVEKLKGMGEGKTNEEKYEIYINFLATLTVLETANFNTENGQTELSFEEIKGTLYTIKDTVSDEELNEVIEKVAQALDNTTLTLSSAKMLNQLIEKLPEGEMAINEIIRGSEEDMNIKMLTSLVTFIAHLKGELESTSGTELSAEQITINVCTGIEETRVVDGVKKGIFTVDNAIKLLKLIGGVALYISLLQVFVSIAGNVGSFVAGMIIGVFGTSTAVSVIAFVAAVICILKVGMTSIREYIPDIMNWTEDKFDTGIKNWRERVWPHIQQKTLEFIDWISGLINKEKVLAVETISSQNAIVSPLNV